MLWWLLACRVAPPESLPEARVAARLPSAPEGCKASFVVVERGIATCSSEGLCELPGRLVDADLEPLPPWKARCEVRYDVLTATTQWVVDQRDPELRGEHLCVTEDGDWVAVEFVGFAARPSRNVAAAYGTGKSMVLLGQPSFPERCVPADQEGSDWPDPPERAPAPPILPEEETLYKPPPLPDDD